jgi:hypothetical protein
LAERRRVLFHLVSADKDMPVVIVVRRLGLSPRERGSLDNGTCPDILELSDGRFAIIGTDVTDQLDGVLPADTRRASYERIVAVTRQTLVAAKVDIPDR